MNNYFNAILDSVITSYILITLNVIFWLAYFHLLIIGGVA